ncbi:MAG: tetratricopeptide repeat protein [Bacteroidales bacterium]|nr:tetratricopeptide repeat protein [Bacteroidales bacterium]
MKRYFIIIALSLLTVFASAQPQQGYVKTKGRMVNGQLEPGQGLKGAVVSLHEYNAVLVNSDDGEFSFQVTTPQFRLDSVKKKGYQLVDMDVCPRNYSYSGNPLYIVMETPDQQLQDKLSAERKIRRNLQKQLQEKEDEIEELKASQKISDDEYRQALQKLYADQESNEQLISDMAKRYSELDYDQLDEFYRQVSFFIENGELVKADSLLNTRGDLNQQVEEQLLRGQAIQAKEQQIEQAKSVHAADNEELAKRCYSYFETFAAQHLNDTAAYYLELRARLDTTNVDWLYDAGLFLESYVGDYDKTFQYYRMGLRQSIQQFGENNAKTALFYAAIGVVSFYISDLQTAMEYFEKSLEIRQSLYGENHPDVAESYANIGAIYSITRQFDKALECHRKSLSINLACHGENHEDVAFSYHNIGFAYARSGDNEKAIEYYLKALEIAVSTLGDNHPTVAGFCQNIGLVYAYLKDYDKALQYMDQASSILISTVGEKHPNLVYVYQNIGYVYLNKGDYDKAREYFDKELEIVETIFGPEHPRSLEAKRVVAAYKEKMKESSHE